MIIFENLDRLIRAETTKALRETLGGHLSGGDQEDQERSRQKRQAKAVQSRGLDKGKVKEVEEADEETGVPEDVDSEDEKREDRTGGKGTKDSPKLATPSKNKLSKVTIGSVIDKLNALRGGKSLKDEKVQKSFKQYFDSLTVKERQSMLVFLTGIAQILAGTKSGADAIDPGDVGLRVKGGVSQQPQGKNSSAEPKTVTSKNAPIVVGEHVNLQVKRAIAAYKKNRGQ